jgi:hypothetical protein
MNTNGHELLKNGSLNTGPYLGVEGEAGEVAAGMDHLVYPVGLHC